MAGQLLKLSLHIFAITSGKLKNLLLPVFLLCLSLISAQTISFGSADVINETVTNPTSLDFGPNGKLYVSEVKGSILEYVIERDNSVPGSGVYTITSENEIFVIKNQIPNHDDNGALNTTKQRQITGILLDGTAANPVIYVSSSDWRIGGKNEPGNDLNLDTNSGVISRLTWNGSSWDKLDLVRGLPRCEENHSTNGMDMFTRNGRKYLLVQQGGNTNQGAPSNNFAGSSEYFLAGAILIVDLTQLEEMEIASGGGYIDQRDGVTKFLYDLPTLNDPERTDINNTHPDFPYTANHPLYNATIDLGDPFGGNNGLNQSFPEAGGPVQIFSPGYRNAYDVVVTQNGNIYTYDNGPNSGWGGPPPIYDSSGNLKGDHYSSSYNPSSGDYITNEFNLEGGKTHGDQLHYVGTINDANNTYYAGHPVPIRAFPSKAGVIEYEYNGSQWVESGNYQWSALLAGVSGYFKSSFTMADFPDDPRQGAYTTDDLGNPDLNMLDIVSSSTNGICEYTASNFEGAMQGDILAASFNGNINRYVLNSSGSGLVLKNNGFLSGFGSTPLDVIAQGDNEIFPGTIWAATYGADKLTVFEPADYGVCPGPEDPDYDPLADYDKDGFTNADEEANGTDICSAGSKPKDNDGDFISDLIDPDDDNDGIADINDVFAIDPLNGTGLNLPVQHPFWNNDPGTGYFGLGFMGLMLDPSGNTDYLDQFDETNMSFGGAGGKATIDFTTSGTADGSVNSQEYGFQFGVNVDVNSAPFTIRSKIELPFNGVLPVSGQSYGIFIGTGDQDNYLKMVLMNGLTAGDNVAGIEVYLEENGTGSSQVFDVPGLIDVIGVDLYFSVDPASQTVNLSYSLDNGQTINPLVNGLSIPASFLDPNDNKGMAVGLISTAGGSGQGYTATWDFIDITEDIPNTLTATPAALDFGTLNKDSSPAELSLELKNDGGVSDPDITVSDLAITGSHAALYSANVSLPITISPGSTAIIPVGFSPDGSAGIKSAEIPLSHDGQNSPLSVPVTAELTDTPVQNPIVRINAGGATDFTATDGGPVWESNPVNGSYTGSLYQVNTGNNYQANFSYAKRHSSIPGYIDQATFDAIYDLERYDPASGPEMVFSIPVENGDYVVNLYLGSSFSGTNIEGSRIFEIYLENQLVNAGFDPVAVFGFEVAGMLSYPVSVTDGVLNVSFGHLVENPQVNAIEIISGSAGNYPALTLAAIEDRRDLPGEIIDFTVSASGGDPNENTSYSISGQPAGIDIEPTNGQIFGTISEAALTGGPAGDGVHQVTVTVDKPSSSPYSTQFQWTVTDDSQIWFDKNESENYTARSECAFVQAGNKFYLFGGRQLPKNIDIYDYVTNTWTTLQSSAPQDFNHVQAVEYGGLIWILGAFKDNNYPDELATEFVWAFDPVSMKWFQGPPIPVSRQRGAAGVAIYQDKFYIVGGNTTGHNGGYVSYFDEFDPYTGEWKQLPDAPHGRDHFQAQVIQGKLYAVSGRLTGGDGGVFAPLVPEVDVYDFNSGSWSTLAADKNLPTPRAGTSVVNYKDQLVVIGGEASTQSSAFFETEIYDPVSASWSAAGDLISPRHGTQGIVSGDGIFITGGSPSKGGGSQKNMEYFNSDNPSGTSLTASVLGYPETVSFNGAVTVNVPLEVTGGNTAVFVNNVSISGSDAEFFNVTSGNLSANILNPDSSHNITVEYSGTASNALAFLTITYNNDQDAIIQLEVGETSATTLFSINAGGPQVDFNSTTFTADQYFSDGKTYTNNSALVPELYQTERSASPPFFSYNIPLDNGNYEIRLHFAEIFFGATGGGVGGVGSRVFDVLMEGNTILDNYDIFAEAGPETPVVKSFPIEITDGELNLYFTAEAAYGGVNQPKLSALEVIAIDKASGSPVASFTAVPTSGAVPLEVSFDASASTDDGSIVNYAWDFGDGNTANGITTSHTYQSAGTFTATLTVTDDQGNSTAEAVTITATDFSSSPPTASFTANPVNGPAPLNVDFDASASTDDGSIVSYAWDFGDGNTSSGTTSVHTYQTAGTYEALLTVTDDEGQSSQSSVTITVASPDGDAVTSLTLVDADSDTDILVLQDGQVLDVAVYGGKNLNVRANTSPETVGSVVFQLTGSLNQTKTESKAPYALFGDSGGNYKGELFPEGSYSLTAIPYSSSGGNGTAGTALTINFSIETVTGNTPPSVAFSADPTSGTIPLEVTFDASASTDDSSIVSYQWDFGDGNTGSGITATHTYQSAGVYTAVLTVTDDAGASASDSIEITATDTGTGDATVFYISPNGNDANNGTDPATPWQTIDKVNTHAFSAGDQILFEAGGSFPGSLIIDKQDAYDPSNPILVSTYGGTSKAMIMAGAGHGIQITDRGGVHFENLIVQGDGLNQNLGVGFLLINQLTGGQKVSNVSVKNSEVLGFGESGIAIVSLNDTSGFSDVLLENLNVHACRDRGITSLGAFSQSKQGYAHQNITVRSCEVFDIPGYDKGEHSGNGIVLSDVQNSVIEYSTVYNSGSGNTNCGGPVGIWYYDADQVTIQFNEVYNMSSGTGCDGGGFDLDGGVTNGVIQYNYSHDNEGPGYLVGQFTGSRAMNNITLRYNISENDARTNLGSITLFNDNTDFAVNNVSIYNNTVYLNETGGHANSSAIAIVDTGNSLGSNIDFYNNILMVENGAALIDISAQHDAGFYGNLYHSTGEFLISYKGSDYTSLDAFRASGNEFLNSENTGVEGDPLFNAPGSGGTIGFGNPLSALTAYKFSENSPAINAGINLSSDIADISDIGTVDFYGNSNQVGSSQDIGSYEYETITGGGTPPTVSFTADPINGTIPLTVNFDASGTTDDGTIVSYIWDFGDGNTGNGVTTTYTFQTAGVFTVTLTVTDDQGNSSSDTVEITATDNSSTAPVASFSADPVNGTAPLLVNFDASASSDNGAITGYDWDFGDGNTASGITTNHTFQTAGSYEVVLTVTDDDGQTGQTSATITVSSPDGDAVVSFTLIDADTNTDLLELQEGQILDVLEYGNRNLNIRANTFPEIVGSVVLELVGPLSNTRKESVSPYALFGDSGGNYKGEQLPQGTYTLTAIPYSSSGGNGTAGTSLTVNFTIGTIAGDTPPSAAFTADPLSGTAPLEVSFDASASSDDGSIVSYEWDFGDGNTGSGITALHTYQTTGSFTATLTVTDDQSNSSTETATITVNENTASPPVASFTADPLSGTVPLEVSFDASASSDDGSIVSYEWDFGDGNTGSGITAIHTYQTTGSFTATLTVTDDQSNSSTETATITVNENTASPPVASFTADPLSGTVPLEVSFDASASSDDGSIVSYEWDFGDGNTGSGVTAIHTYQTTGSFTATLTVTDDQSNSSTETATIMVIENTASPPVASFTADPLSGTVPLEVSFDASASSDDGSIVSYEWDFGDGNTGSGVTTLHTYQTAGSFTATLTVTDDQGNPDSETATIVVNETLTGPVAIITADPLSGTSPLTVQFSGSGSVPGDSPISSYEWSFGDGNTSFAAEPQHIYQNAGSYITTLVVTDGNGLTDQESVTINVSEPGDAVTSFTLVNAETNADLYEIQDGAVLDANELGAIFINIRANTSPSVVGSVVMNLSGAATVSRTESVAPYALFGDSGGDYYGSKLPEGNYVLSATPYSSSGGNGTAGASLTVSFSISPATATKFPDEVTEGEIYNGSSEEPLLYPNPGSDYIRLATGDQSPSKSLFRIFDINGRLVKEVNPEFQSGVYTISTSDLQNGNYILSSESTDGVSSSYRFSIVK
ncbi:PKD domain-containing protein [Robertkochia aurantiaca]|uniref:PKD domain-containing protein n=1 Tax=Robertkochia aurantiaca TaxID=2873700 RepID=UPI001CCBB285|nr:PKD domain-containing protein [Robertkochia sp. 3YJGBD-33]